MSPLQSGTSTWNADLYVSDAMAKAVLAARPDFASKPAEVKLLLEKQFPEKAGRFD